MASNLADALKIKKALTKYNVPNMIDFSFVGSQAFIEAKKLLQNKFINNIKAITINWHRETKTSLEQNSNHWKTKSTLGGGVLYNFASHVLFYLEWLTDKTISKISAKKYNLLGKKLGDNLTQITANLSDGVIVNVVINTSAFMGSGHKIEIYGDNASIILENSSYQSISEFTLKTATRKSNSWHNISLKNPIKLLPREDGRIIAVSNLVNKFVNWIITGKPEQPNFMDGIRIQKLLEKC